MKDIFNMDETVLFFKDTSRKTLFLKVKTVQVAKELKNE